MQNCPQCKATLSGTPRFCPECGHPVAMDANGTTPPKAASKSGGLKMRDVSVVLGVLVVFTIGFFIFKTPGEPPQPEGSGIPGHDGGMGMGESIDLPVDYAGLVQTGNEGMDKGNFLLATEAYRRALALDPSSPDVRVDYGACLYAMGLPERAIEEFSNVIQAVPNHAVAHFNMGIVFHSLGQVDSARVYWERYLEIDPDGPSAPTARQLLSQIEG